MASDEPDTLHGLSMLKYTVNSSYQIIWKNCLYSEADELTVVDCMLSTTFDVEPMILAVDKPLLAKGMFVKCYGIYDIFVPII